MLRGYASLVRHPDNMSLFKAVEMSIVAAQRQSPLHIHAEGLRGTGKTTIMRSVKSILPRIKRIKGCLYNCDPQAPHCPEHKGLSAVELAQLGTEWVAMPFLEISHAAKVATVVGSIDLEKLVEVKSPAIALLPGTLAQAHRGIVFIDEINRLADTSPELADVLLDVMGTKPGRLQIEDAGLPKVELSSLVTVWAASNPDEDPGPLEGIRRQLADRFDLCISVRRPASHATIMAILQQQGATADGGQVEKAERAVGARMASGLQRLEAMHIPDRMLSILADIYLDYSLESIRSLEAITLAAKVHAALEGKDVVETLDLQGVVPLALRHRVAPHVLDDILNMLNQVCQPRIQVERGEEMESEPLEAATGKSEASLPEQQNFWGRWLSSWRERSAEEKQDEKKQPALTQAMPVALPSLAAQEKQPTEAGLANPELIQVMAPPKPARTLAEMPDADLVLGEAELRRR